jgi:hypothetical protein
MTQSTGGKGTLRDINFCTPSSHPISEQITLLMLFTNSVVRNSHRDSMGEFNQTNEKV